MLPVLFEWDGFVLYSYGVAIFVGATLGGYLAWRLRRRHLFDFDQFLSICLITTGGAALGARFLFALEQGSLDAEGAFAALRVWEKGGLASVGVPLVVLPLLVAYFRWRRLPTLEVFDYLMPFTLFGAAFQRAFGCFLGGCCHGKPTEMPWGIIFPGDHVTVHPTQLYLAVPLFVVFALAVRWQPPIAGFKSLVVLGSYAAISLPVSFFRSGLVVVPGWGVPRMPLIYGALLAGCLFLGARLRKSASPPSMVVKGEGARLPSGSEGCPRERSGMKGSLFGGVGGLLLAILCLAGSVPASAAENLTIRWSRDVVRWGEPVTLEVKSYNLVGRGVQGGITVSFSSNVVVTQHDPEAHIYYENSEIFSAGHRGTMRSREIMIENWYDDWPPFTSRSLRLTFFPLKTGYMTVKIRTAMIRSVTRRDVVNFPSRSACHDQQNYPAQCHKILIQESENLLDNLRRIINTDMADDPVFVENLQALIRDPNDRRAQAYFGMEAIVDSRQYLDDYLQAMAERIEDPSIRDSPHLMTYLRRLINDPLDERALRFFKLLKKPEPIDPYEAYVEGVEDYLSDQQAGPNLLSLIAAEKDVQFGYSKDDRWIILVHRNRTHTFRRRSGVVLAIIEKIMEFKPHSKFIRQADEVSGYSYQELRKILRKGR